MSPAGATGVVHVLELGPRDVADRLEKPSIVEPVDPLERREFNLLDEEPGPRSLRRLHGGSSVDAQILDPYHGFPHGSRTPSV